jgi:hypothetical protein
LPKHLKVTVELSPSSAIEVAPKETPAAVNKLAAAVAMIINS